MKKLLYCFYLSITSLVGQNLALEFIPVSHPEFQNKDNSVPQIYQLNRQFLDQIRSNPEKLEISLNIGSMELTSLTARKYSVFSKQLAIQIISSPKVSKFSEANGTLYRIDSNSFFDEGLISIGAEYLYLWWRIGEEQFMLEPLHLSSDSIHEPIYVLRKPIAVLKEAFCNHPNNPSLNGISEMTFKNVKNAQNDSCVSVQLACAMDWSFVKTMRNMDLAVQHLEFTIGLVEWQYSGWFDKDISFELKDLFISNCDGCDPPEWKPEKNSVKLLQNFIDWGENNGFGNQSNHHLAFLMTYRFLSDLVYVQSFPSRVCAKSKYFIQQSLKNVSADKYLTAHEIAHFFGVFHDTDSSGFIMSNAPGPTLEIPIKWSSQSVQMINSFLKSDTCLSTCTINNAAPVAFFTSNITEHCGPVFIQFNDLSLNSPINWLWSFEGGTPAKSTERNPLVSYSQPGSYEVNLMASNTFGNDLLTKSQFITIHQKPEIAFQLNLNGLTLDIVNLTKNAISYFWDFGDGTKSTSALPTHTYLKEGTYKITVVASNINCTDTFETEIHVMATSSRQLNMDSQVRIYPNPGNGFIQIIIPSSLQFTLKAYSFDGKEVFEEQLKEDKNFIQFPEYFPNGIYRLVFVSKEMKPVHLNYILIR